MRKRKIILPPLTTLILTQMMDSKSMQSALEKSGLHPPKEGVSPEKAA